MFAHVASMIQLFNMQNIRILIEQGYTVDVACNMEQGSVISKEKIAEMKQELEMMGIRVFHIPVPRKLSALSEIVRSCWQTYVLINENKYEIIHCHSPIGGIVCRLANRFSKSYHQTKMIYTAHGFHFFKGNNPLKNVVFRTIEAVAARFTDILITINAEDYAAAKTFHLKKGGRVEYVPGVGVDLERIKQFMPCREELCQSHNIPNHSTLLLSVGELNENKNHKIVVEALSKLPNNYHYLICGQGNNQEMLEQLAQELNCENRLHILGYRDDVPSIIKSCDIFIFPSKREGLSVALMEAMSAGKAIVCSKIRGNTDLIKQGEGGFLVDATDVDGYIQAITQLSENETYRNAMGEVNCNNIKRFDCASIGHEMTMIYASCRKAGE